MYICSYNTKSASIRELADLLAFPRSSLGNPSQLRAILGSSLRNTLAFNYGCDVAVPSRETQASMRRNRLKVLNGPRAHTLSTYTDKLKFFQKFNETGLLPEFSTDWAYVSRQLAGEGSSQWVARLVTRGHSGEGIVMVNPFFARLIGNTPGDAYIDALNHVNIRMGEVAEAPLYVKYIPKAEEYRVHFFKQPDGAVNFLIHQKRLKRDLPVAVPDRFKIRNLARGWIYSRHDVIHRDAVRSAAERLVAEMSLDFGAIDVIYNARSDRAYVLEVNTAPGMTGELAQWYATQIGNWRTAGYL